VPLEIHWREKLASNAPGGGSTGKSHHEGDNSEYISFRGEYTAKEALILCRGGKKVRRRSQKALQCREKNRRAWPVEKRAAKKRPRKKDASTGEGKVGDLIRPGAQTCGGIRSEGKKETGP